MGPIETKIAIAIGMRLFDKLVNPDDKDSIMIGAIIAAETEEQVRAIVNEQLSELVAKSVFPPVGTDEAMDLISDLVEADTREEVKKAVNRPSVQKILTDIIYTMMQGMWRMVFGGK